MKYVVNKVSHEELGNFQMLMEGGSPAMVVTVTLYRDARSTNVKAEL